MLSDTPTQTPSARPDYVTIALAYVVALLPSVHMEKEEIAVIGRQISLGLVGVIILSSIRMVLRGVARVRQFCALNSSCPAHLCRPDFSHSQPEPRGISYGARHCAAYGMLILSFSRRKLYS